MTMSIGSVSTPLHTTGPWLRPPSVSATGNEADDGPNASGAEDKGGASDSAAQSTRSMDAAEQRELQALRQRDSEVRAHEAAHLAAAGQYARGGASFEYERGPDGRQYAVGGEVSIDTSRVPNDPEATLEKAETVRRAALAPAEPSPTDRQVAAQATAMAAEARAEIAAEKREGQDSARSGAGIDIYARNSGEQQSSLSVWA